MLDKTILSLLIFILIFSPLAHGSVLPWQMAVVEAGAAVMALLWWYRLCKPATENMPVSDGTRQGIVNAAPDNGVLIRIPGIIFFGLFIFYCVFQLAAGGGALRSGGSAPATVYPYATGAELLRIMAYFLLFTVTLHVARSRRRIALLLSIIVAVGYIAGLASLLRYFNKSVPRTLINPDHLAGYLGMVLPLGLGLVLAGREAGFRYARAEKQLLLLFCLAVIAVALLFTMSRGGMFSMTGALLIMAVLTVSRQALRRKGWIVVPVMILVTAVMAWLGATPVIERIMSIKAEVTSHYFDGRWPIWKGTTALIGEHYLFGTGLGTFAEVFPAQQPVRIIRKHYAHAHSDYMELLSDTGIAGFALFMAGILFLLVHLLKKYRRQRSRYAIGLSIGFWGSLASIGIHSLVDFNLHIPSNAVLVSVLLALFTATLDPAPGVGGRAGNAAGRSKRRSFIFSPLVAVAGVLYIIVAAKPAFADYYFQKAAVPGTPAIRLLDRAVALDPGNAQYHYALGGAYYRRGDIERALAGYRTAVRLNPNNSQYCQSLAWACGQCAAVQAQKTAQDPYDILARRYFERAIALNPHNPYGYRIYARYMLPRDHTRAIALYRKALAVQSALTAEALRACINDAQGMEQIRELLPGTAQSDFQAFVYFTRKNGLPFGITVAQKYLATYPSNAAICFSIADRSFYDKRYSWEFTERYYQKTFALDPSNASYALWYGIHLSYRKEYQKALRFLEKAHHLSDEPAQLREIRKFIQICRRSISAAERN